MKIHRFYYTDFVPDTTFSINTKEIVHQITKVLKLKSGEHIELFDGEGNSYTCEILSLSKTTIEVLVTTKAHSDKPHRNVGLFFALLKKENTEYAIEKAVEVGVSEIVPILTTRTVKSGIKTERVHSIIKEATEQSGRTYIPTLLETMKFTDALHFAQNNFSRVVVFDPHGTQFRSGGEDSIAVFVGPEGGFTEEEILLAQSKGIEVVSLPTHILRGETAAIISVYTALL